MHTEKEVPGYLQTLWKNMVHDQDIAFLRRAFETDLSLSDVLAVLQYEALSLDRQRVTLREVMTATVKPEAMTHP